MINAEERRIIINWNQFCSNSLTNCVKKKSKFETIFKYGHVSRIKEMYYEK